MTARVQLRRNAGRVGPEHGPWIRARQIQRWIGVPDPARPIELVDRHGQTLGWGLPSERSSIAVRMLTWGPTAPPPDWLARRLEQALIARTTQGWEAQPTTGIRLVNSEGDGLPGLVVDRYDAQLVVQVTTASMVAHQAAIVDALRSLHPGPRHSTAIHPTAIHVVRPEGPAEAEGYTPGVIREGAQQHLTFVEHGLQLRVSAPPSQKTGAYFDQRANRRRVATLARHAEGPLLDLGCHVGGFALHAATQGVPAVGVDRSAAMLARAAEHAALNELTGLQWVEADLFGPLDDPRLAGPFGTIVVDPPKLAARRRDVERAAEAMRRLVTRVAPRLQLGGHLVLCSCSHHLGREHLDRCVLAAPGRYTRVGSLGADLDHPVAPGHAEGEYLRVMLYQRRA